MNTELSEKPKEKYQKLPVQVEGVFLIIFIYFTPPTKTSRTFYHPHFKANIKMFRSEGGPDAGTEEETGS